MNAPKAGAASTGSADAATEALGATSAQAGVLKGLSWALAIIPIVKSDDPGYTALGISSGFLVGALLTVGLFGVKGAESSHVVFALAMLALSVACAGIGAAIANVVRRRTDPIARAHARYQSDLQVIAEAGLPEARATRERELAFDRFNVAKEALGPVDPAMMERVRVVLDPPDGSPEPDQGEQEAEAEASHQSVKKSASSDVRPF